MYGCGHQNLKSEVQNLSSFDKTMKFNFPEEPVETNVNEVLFNVYDALQEKGYDPIIVND